MTEKQCTKCKQYKNIIDFISRIGDGYKICKVCEGCRKKSRKCWLKFANNNREKIREKSRQWNVAHKEEISQRQNQQKYKDVRKKYAEEHVEEIKVIKQKYYTENKKEIQNKRKIYSYENRALILWQSAKSRAKRSGKEFSLLLENIQIPDICPYLGTPIIIEIESGAINSPSIDRINNNCGYTNNNIIIVSNRANLIKRDFSLEEIKLIAKNYDKISDFSKVDQYANPYINIIISKCDSKFDKIYRKQIIRKILYRNARKRAKIKNIEFLITIDDIKIPNICPILEIPIRLGNERVCDNSPTIDRIDNSKGYTPENIRIISYRANTAKRDTTKEEYQLFAKNLEKIMTDRGLLG